MATLLLAHPLYMSAVCVFYGIPRRRDEYCPAETTSWARELSDLSPGFGSTAEAKVAAQLVARKLSGLGSGFGRCKHRRGW